MIVALISGIAGGKTLLSEFIKKELDIFFVDESLSILTNINGENALEKYYSEMSRYSFVTELLFFITRIEKISSIKGGSGIVLMERDWESGMECFTKMLFEDKFLSEAEYTIIRKFRMIAKSRIPKIDKYIYIRVSQTTLMERLRKRGRHEEETPDMDRYQKRLVEGYEDFIIGKDVLIIDGEKDYKNSEIEKNSAIEKIRLFINAKYRDDS